MDRQEVVDLRYLRICREYAQLTRCLSRKVGALIVTPDNIPIAMGVNGPPRGIEHCQDACPRKKDGEKLPLSICPAVHAEVNAILACARTNNATSGCTMYIYPLGPCKDCMAAIINAGIERLVFPWSHWYDDLAPKMLAQTSIETKLYEVDEIHSLDY